MLKLCPLMAAILDADWDLLKGHHPRTIHAMSALNWLTGFRGKKLNIFPKRFYVEYPIGTKNKFCRGPFNDHPFYVCFKLVYWCQSRKFSHIFSRTVLC